MNTPEVKESVTPELPKGYRPVESILPEGLDVSARMLTEPGRITARMRKNMWGLREKITPSHAPIVRVDDTEGGRHGYAWNTGAKISDDVRLENRLRQLNARQLLKLRHRCAVRALRIGEKASLVKAPAIARRMLDHVDRLRNIGSAADAELRFERWGHVFENPDGN